MIVVKEFRKIGGGNSYHLNIYPGQPKASLELATLKNKFIRTQKTLTESMENVNLDSCILFLVCKLKILLVLDCAAAGRRGFGD